MLAIPSLAACGWLAQSSTSRKTNNVVPLSNITEEKEPPEPPPDEDESKPPIEEPPTEEPPVKEPSPKNHSIVVCQNDKLGRSAVIIGAKTYDLDLGHSGRKIARN